MARVRWTFQALDDLEAVCLYLAHDNPFVARVFAQRAFRATDGLSRFPLRGRVVPELGRDELREIFLQSYRIIYRIRGDDVEVLTIQHGARLLGREKLGPDDEG